MSDNRQQHDINIDQTGLKKGEKLVIRRDSQGRVTEVEKRDACWVVTATFGSESRELRQVTRRCRRTFAVNPFLFPGWCLYRLCGSSLAEWADASDTGARLCKAFLATPIVNATERTGMNALIARVYLVFLTLVSPLVLVPFWLFRTFSGSRKRREIGAR